MAAIKRILKKNPKKTKKNIQVACKWRWKSDILHTSYLVIVGEVEATFQETVDLVKTLHFNIKGG